MRDDPLQGLLGYQLRRASAVMMADLAESLADLDLTVLGMSVLLTIEAGQARTQSDIGRLLGVQRANMAPLAAGLVEQGLIAREAMDGRSHALVLTRAGTALLRRAHRRVTEHEARFCSRVPEAERARLLELLESLWRRDPPPS